MAFLRTPCSTGWGEQGLLVLGSSFFVVGFNMSCIQTEPTPRERERLETLVRESVDISADGCWIWRRGIKSRDEGCGVVWFRGKSWRAHRLAFMVFRGQLPDQLLRHTCGNSQCVNPDHLQPGTHSQNLADAYQHGARRKPIRLTNSIKRLISDLYLTHNSRQIADQLQLPESTVRDHLRRVTCLAGGGLQMADGQKTEAAIG